MKYLIVSLALVALPAHAAAPLAVAAQYGCLACHAVDHNIVGPAWKDVAQRYRGQAGAEAMLIEKVRKGGSGHWGSTPMPPNPGPSETELKELVQFILALK